MKPKRSKGRNPNLGRPAEFPGDAPEAVSPQAASGVAPAVVPAGATLPEKRYWLVCAAVTACLTAWLFWPALASMVAVWDKEPDYSHGFLVAPFAVLMLWLRRESRPAYTVVPGWGGVALLALSFVVRYVGERFFIAPLSGWALVLWISGACWLLAGWQMFRWAAPSLAFLLFMVPLPLSFEQLLSWRLQGVATKLSTFMLQCLGQPAIAERHTIFLGEHVLEIERACSGLRMLMGIAAVAFVFVVLNRRPWWERIVVALGVVPVAVLSNALRIVTTGLLLQLVSSDAAARFSHDAAGWGMILVSALLFWLLVTYLRRLIVPVEVETGRDVLRSAATA